MDVSIIRHVNVIQTQSREAYYGRLEDNNNDNNLILSFILWFIIYFINKNNKSHLASGFWLVCFGFSVRDETWHVGVMRMSDRSWACVFEGEQGHVYPGLAAQRSTVSRPSSSSRSAKAASRSSSWWVRLSTQSRSSSWGRKRHLMTHTKQTIQNNPSYKETIYFILFDILDSVFPFPTS